MLMAVLALAMVTAVASAKMSTGFARSRMLPFVLVLSAIVCMAFSRTALGFPHPTPALQVPVQAKQTPQPTAPEANSASNGSEQSSKPAPFSQEKVVAEAKPAAAGAGYVRMEGGRPVVSIRRCERAPKLEDFLGMKPSDEIAGSLTKMDGFIQAKPKDGVPPTFPTEAYMCYDDNNLYVNFIAFDNEPGKVRASMTKREPPGFFEDDVLELRFDTFDDRRRSYYFAINPFGVQYDALWPEGEGGFDPSFDTLWYSAGQLTESGYVAWVKIPFKSLRFSSESKQSWGFYLGRLVPRLSEGNGWPHLTLKNPSLLSQTARLDGMDSISPGHNIQIIPYGMVRSFRELDLRDPTDPKFVDHRASTQFGADGKIVLKDSFVLDITGNPDFSQVESDEPQVTVNQRFEVFFPEKRPFFLENANYFKTPINLVFTRRIVSPQFGVRLTGKKGPWTLATLFANDEGPGEIVPESSPLFDKKANFVIVRVAHDIFKQSSVGMIYTDRRFLGSYNQVGGIDTRLKLNRNWLINAQAVASKTRLLNGQELSGAAYLVALQGEGRQFSFNTAFNDRAPGFRTQVGFEPRFDIRRLNTSYSYRWRPEGKTLIAWGPNVGLVSMWDHKNTRLEWTFTPSIALEFARQTNVNVFYAPGRELLRPQDFFGLRENRDFSPRDIGVTFSSAYFSKAIFSATLTRGQTINFEPPFGREPFMADSGFRNIKVTLRPIQNVQIDNTYLETRLTKNDLNAHIFTDRIFRVRVNWQLNRKLSLRAIPQYNSLIVNPVQTSLAETRNFTGDFLATYQLNPWTALYVGYNSNLQNLELITTPDGRRVLRRTGDFHNDARQMYVKFSYLFRF
jgi:hypothetical protein